jgi:hypothetical protein
MEYADFVREWNAGRLSVDVDRTKALAIGGSNILPKKYQFANIFWSWVWLLSIPLGIAIGIFYKWWVGLLVVFFVAPILSRATKTSAMQFMIDYSLESPEFFQYALKEGVINVRPKA